MLNLGGGGGNSSDGGGGGSIINGGASEERVNSENDGQGRVGLVSFSPS